MKFAKDFLAMAIIFVIVCCGLATSMDRRVSAVASPSEE